MNLFNLPPVPQELLSFLTNSEENSSLNLSSKPLESVGYSYAQAALKGAITAVENAQEGERNSTLNKEAHGLFRLIAALPVPLIISELTQAAKKCGLPECEINRTLQSSAKARGINLKNPPPPAVFSNVERPVFSFIRADELQDVKQQFLVEDIIPKHSLTMIFGPSGGGKTFVALNIGLSIASGIYWYGHCAKQGAVLYICGEGKAGIKKRLQAWAAYTGKSLDGVPFYISSGAADFSDPSSLMQVQQAIETLKIHPALIIIDTLSRNNSADENDTAAMAGFVKALDGLKDKYQASVLIVHHTGHTEKERARGSSVLKAALDTEFRVNKSGSLVTFSCTKMKDSEEPETKQFELRAIPVVTNGVLDTGAVLSLAAQPAIRISPQNEQALELLRTSKSPIAVDEFEKQLVLKGIIDAKPENIRRILKRIIKELSDKGLLSEADGFLKATDKTDSARTTAGQGGQLGMNSIPLSDGQDSPPIGAVRCPNGGLNG